MRLFTLLLLCAGLLRPARAQWQLQESNTAADLRAVHALSGEVAWASGAEGTVLRTADGGATWQHCVTPLEADHLDFRGVQGFDANTALVMSSGKGPLSRLYKTVDGCKSWHLVLTNPDPEGTWSSIQFQYTPGTAAGKGYFGAGVLIGHPVHGEFVILTSKDYGNTWKALHDDEAYAPGPSARANQGELLFATSNTALTAIADDNTFAFVTGGEAGARLLHPDVHREHYDAVSLSCSFSALPLPIAANANAGGFSIAARRTGPDRADLMIVGGDASKPDAGGAAVFVRHGGNLKKLLSPRAIVAEHPPAGYRSAVAYDGASNSWIAVGPNGSDVSGDDGRTWTPLGASNTDSSRNWQALSLPFVVGPAGRIGKLRGAPTARETLNASR